MILQTLFCKLSFKYATTPVRSHYAIAQCNGSDAEIITNAGVTVLHQAMCMSRFSWSRYDIVLGASAPGLYTMNAKFSCWVMT